MIRLFAPRICPPGAKRICRPSSDRMFSRTWERYPAFASGGSVRNTAVWAATAPTTIQAARPSSTRISIGDSYGGWLRNGGYFRRGAAKAPEKHREARAGNGQRVDSLKGVLVRQ